MLLVLLILYLVVFSKFGYKYCESLEESGIDALKLSFEIVLFLYFEYLVLIYSGDFYLSLPVLMLGANVHS